MPPAGARWGPRDVAEGPPSEQACASLSEQLRREVADARVRFEEASLRAETHRMLGDDARAAEVVREQERLLADVQDRLGRAVSAAVVERDAEQVLADLGATERRPLGPTQRPPLTPTQRRPRPVWRPPAVVTPTEPAAVDHRRTPALAGVASMVVVLAVAAAGVLGLARGWDRVEVAEVSADSTVDETAPDAAPTTPSSSLVGPTRGPDRDGTVGPSSPPATASDVPAATEAAAAEDGTDAPSPTPTPTPDLGTVVQELVDAVSGLDESSLGPVDQDTESSSEDSGAAVPSVDELLEGPTSQGAEQPGTDPDGDDGFVPGG